MKFNKGDIVVLTAVNMRGEVLEINKQAQALVELDRVNPPHWYNFSDLQLYSNGPGDNRELVLEILEKINKWEKNLELHYPGTLARIKAQPRHCPTCGK